MQIALAVLHELAQKRIIDMPDYHFTAVGDSHQKEFTCRIDLNGFHSFWLFSFSCGS